MKGWRHRLPRQTCPDALCYVLPTRSVPSGKLPPPLPSAAALETPAPAPPSRGAKAFLTHSKTPWTCHPERRARSGRSDRIPRMDRGG